MELHEYQAKNLLIQFGIPTPPFYVASSMTDVEEILETTGLQAAVVKVQVHAGGRGKAGGVKIGHNREEILAISKALLGMKIINNQTGENGLVAHSILITEPVNILQEYYLAVTIDRKTASISLIASKEGGINIETVASQDPQKILIEKVEKQGPLIDKAIAFFGWKKEQEQQGRRLLQGVLAAFLELDALLLEVNPLAWTKEEKLVALDTKLTIDDNALFRHPEIAVLYDPTQSIPQEVEAKTYDLAYVGLNGNIGCMVNGAGLAMATMDLIRLKGGCPANFLDVGGGATKEKIIAGFRILLSDKRVKAVLVNIFGGIMNCATIAEALEEVFAIHGKIPVVVRMEGNNVEEARKILASLDVVMAETFDQAAEMVVAYGNTR
jgi:succinyl-CoA synthetase beta subunit